MVSEQEDAEGNSAAGTDIIVLINYFMLLRIYSYLSSYYFIFLSRTVQILRIVLCISFQKSSWIYFECFQDKKDVFSDSFHTY